MTAVVALGDPLGVADALRDEAAAFDAWCLAETPLTFHEWREEHRRAEEREAEYRLAETLTREREERRHAAERAAYEDRCTEMRELTLHAVEREIREQAVTSPGIMDRDGNIGPCWFTDYRAMTVAALVRERLAERAAADFYEFVRTARVASSAIPFRPIDPALAELMRRYSFGR